MTNLEIFETKRDFNKWLSELTESENLLVMEMMDEARELGYDKGIKDDKSSLRSRYLAIAHNELYMVCSRSTKIIRLKTKH